MIELFGQPPQKDPDAAAASTLLRTILLGGGLLVIVLCFLFPGPVAFLFYVSWDDLPNPIVALSLRADTEYYGTPAWSLRAQRNFGQPDSDLTLSTRLAQQNSRSPLPWATRRPSE
jgi:hypothetical protein